MTTISPRPSRTCESTKTPRSPRCGRSWRPRRHQPDRRETQRWCWQLSGRALNALRPALALSEDPAGRTKFIHGYQQFHGDLREAAQALDAAKTDPAAADFRSGLCAALGLIPWKEMQAEEQTALRTTLVGLYTDARDGGTHSAAFFALKRWGQLPRSVKCRSRPPDGTCGDAPEGPAGPSGPTAAGLSTVWA